MKPSIGRIVIANVQLDFNGTDVQPAIITRVWNGVDTADGAPACVNLKVLPDVSEPFDMTSVMLFDNEAAARASGQKLAAWWPERV